MSKTGGSGTGLGRMWRYLPTCGMSLAMAMVGCSLFGGVDPLGVADDRMSLPAGGSGVSGPDRDSIPTAKGADLKALMEGNSGFALGLYRD